MASVVAPKERDKFLAYEHAATIQTDEGKVKPLFDRLVAACEADRDNQCALMKSSVEGGRYEAAQLRMRAKSAGINKLLALAAAGGELARQETSVEDLARPVADNAKRLEMLHAYQQKLDKLARKPGLDADALIKLAKEQASVQSELEQANGEAAHLLARMNLDILNVTIQSRERQSFWTPVRYAAEGFGGNLSSGIASVVTGLAYLLPWLLVMALAFWLLRKLWRKVAKK
ncbi:DUF4349 domain-containing protein [Duganella guangzhouensis]|nr:DUF4349 domain-containing protein [Duganella guangzhouensis]